VLLAVLRGRRDDHSWTKLDDNERVIAMQLVAAGAITEDHGMLAPSDELARASSRVSCLHSTGDTQSSDR